MFAPIKTGCYWYDEVQDMQARIPICRAKKGGPYEVIVRGEDCAECKEYHSKWKQTNADKIRAKTDEELADWLVLVEMRIRQLQAVPEIRTLKKDWLDWLQQEANDG